MFIGEATLSGPFPPGALEVEVDLICKFGIQFMRRTYCSLLKVEYVMYVYFPCDNGHVIQLALDK